MGSSPHLTNGPACQSVLKQGTASLPPRGYLTTFYWGRHGGEYCSVFGGCNALWWPHWSLLALRKQWLWTADPPQCQALPRRSSLPCKHNKSALSVYHPATLLLWRKKMGKCQCFPLIYCQTCTHGHANTQHTHMQTSHHNTELTMIVDFVEVVFGLSHSKACGHMSALKAPQECPLWEITELYLIIR